MISGSKVVINDALQDGVLAGFSIEGRCVVVIEFHPNYSYVWGAPDDQDNVFEWHACKAHARRLAMVAAWRGANYACRGNA